MDSHSTSTGLQTTTGPPTTSWEGSISGSESNLAATLQATPETATSTKSEKADAAAAKSQKEEEDDVESDWE